MRLKAGKPTRPSFAFILFYYLHVCLSSHNALIVVPRTQLLARDESSVRHDDYTMMPLPSGA